MLTFSTPTTYCLTLSPTYYSYSHPYTIAYISTTTTHKPNSPTPAYLLPILPSTQCPQCYPSTTHTPTNPLPTLPLPTIHTPTHPFSAHIPNYPVLTFPPTYYPSTHFSHSQPLTSQHTHLLHYKPNQYLTHTLTTNPTHPLPNTPTHGPTHPLTSKHTN